MYVDDPSPAILSKRVASHPACIQVQIHVGLGFPEVAINMYIYLYVYIPVNDIAHVWRIFQAADKQAFKSVSESGVIDRLEGQFLKRRARHGARGSSSVGVSPAAGRLVDFVGGSPSWKR